MNQNVKHEPHYTKCNTKNHQSVKLSVNYPTVLPEMAVTVRVSFRANSFKCIGVSVAVTCWEARQYLYNTETTLMLRKWRIFVKAIGVNINKT